MMGKEFYLTKALRGKEHGKFGNYLASSNIQKYLPGRLIPLNDADHDRVPRGYNSEDLWMFV